jgi:hypothetical protein
MSFNNDEAEAAYKAVDRYVNRFGSYKPLAEMLANNHPTLQQNTMKMFVEFLRQMAAKPYADARNEGSVALAKVLVETVDTSNIGLPTV